VLYPLLTAFLYSLTSWNGADPIKTFIGFDNYARIFSDPKVSQALSHNAVWIVLGSIGVISLSLLMAILVSRTRFQALFSTIYFLPVLLASSAVGVIWTQIYLPDGILNNALGSVGLTDFERGWLGDTDTALIAVLVAWTWATVGFNFVIFLAAIKNVDQDLIDAAYVDGAGAWMRLRNVTLPQIRSVLTTVVVLTLISGFTAFDLVFVMTQGGPASSTELIATYAYRKAFVGNEVGYAAAVSVLITILASAAALIYLRFRPDQN
jgi:ABC-type sugar transport system permease subunit